MLVSSSSTSSATSAASEPEAWPRRLAVMEVDPGGGSVRRVGDAEVHADLEAGYLRPVHRLPGLLRVLDSLKVNEGKSSGPFGRAVQHDLDFLKFAESAELSLQISLSGGEIESKHPDTVG